MPEKVPEGSTGRESRVGPVGGLARWRRWPGRNKQHRKTGGTRNTAFYIYLLLLPGFFFRVPAGDVPYSQLLSAAPNGVPRSSATHWTPPHRGSDFYHSKVSVNPFTIIQAKQKSNKRPRRRSKLHKEIRIFRSNVGPSFSLWVCVCTANVKYSGDIITGLSVGRYPLFPSERPWLGISGLKTFFCPTTPLCAGFQGRRCQPPNSNI